MCQAITLKGSECKRSSVNDEEYCRKHLQIEKYYSSNKLFFQCQFDYKTVVDVKIDMKTKSIIAHFINVRLI